MPVSMSSLSLLAEAEGGWRLATAGGSRWVNKENDFEYTNGMRMMDSVAELWRGREKVNHKHGRDNTCGRKWPGGLGRC